MANPEELSQNTFDNGGDEELRDDRGDLFVGDGDDADGSANGKPDGATASNAEGAGDGKGNGGATGDSSGNVDPTGASGETVQEDQDPANGKPDKRGVPYERFNSVNEQKKALEQQNELLKQLLAQQQGAKPESDGKADQVQNKADEPGSDDAKQLRELRRQLKEALYADDDAKYDEIQDQIDSINERRNRAAVRAEMESAQQATAAQAERRQFETVANEMVSKYPVLNSENGNPEAIKKVVALRDYYISHEKLSPSAALRKASDEIGELYSVEKDGQGQGQQQKAAQDLRKSAAIERGVNEANNQPPPTSMAGVGARAQAARLNPEKMSEREFKDLPEEERARLRGDVA